MKATQITTSTTDHNCVKAGAMITNMKTGRRHEILKSEYIKTTSRPSGLQVGPTKITAHEYRLEVAL